MIISHWIEWLVTGIGLLYISSSHELKDLLGKVMTARAPTVSYWTATQAKPGGYQE